MEYSHVEKVLPIEDHVEKGTRVEVGQSSCRGRNHILKQKENEDSLFVSLERQLFAVFDGVGGMAEGGLAAQAAAEYLAGEEVQHLLEPRKSQYHFAQMHEILMGLDDYVFEQVSAKIRVKGLTPQTPREQREGGAAGIIALMHGQSKEFRQLVLGHSGDCRAYLRRHGVLTRLTQDHSYVRNMLEEGRITEKEYLATLAQMDRALSPAQLKGVEAEAFGFRNQILQFFGGFRLFMPEVQSVPVQPGDEILLTSDGVHDQLTIQKIAAIMALGTSSQQVAEALTEAAHKCDSDRRTGDDATAVVIKF